MIAVICAFFKSWYFQPFETMVRLVLMVLLESMDHLVLTLVRRVLAERRFRHSVPEMLST